MTILYLVLGTVFGFVLSRSGAADYDYVQAMFLFSNVQLYVGRVPIIWYPYLYQSLNQILKIERKDYQRMIMKLV